MPLLLHAAPLLLALLCSLLLALLCSLLLSLRAPSGSSIGSLPKLCCSLLEFSPHTRGTCLLQGRKTKDISRSVTCAAACLCCVSMCRRFWSRAKSRGAWRDAGPAAFDSPQPPTRADEPRPLHQAAFHPVKVKMRPGAAATAHQRRRTAAGRHRPLAQRSTSCCVVTGASSAALRGVECFASSYFSMNPPHPFPLISDPLTPVAGWLLQRPPGVGLPQLPRSQSDTGAD